MNNSRLKLIVVISIALLFTLLFTSYPNNLFAQGSLPICAVSGQITQNTTWTADCLYRVDNHVTVPANVTLTIQAGTIVKFAGGKALRVKGTLKVQGTANQPVTFTSLPDDSVGGDTNNDDQATLPDKGQWGHISFVNESLDSQNLIDYAVIRYGGYYKDNECFYGGCGVEYLGVNLFFTASPTIRNTRFEHNNGYALSGDANSFPTLSALTFFQNRGNAFEIRNGVLNSSEATTHRWSNADVVYVLTGYLLIDSGHILIVDPGIIVKFAGGKTIRIKGTFKVQGTTDKPVYFTSLSDDTIGGDTNNDGQATLPDKGQWGHLSFLNESLDSQNLIDHAVFRYGGYYRDHDCFYGGCGAEYRGALWFFTASPTARNITFEQNTGYAVTGDANSFPVLSGLTFVQNEGNAFEIRNGILNSSEATIHRWSNTDVIYVLTGYLLVDSGHILIIDSGIIIKLASNKTMRVKGTLKVQGAVDKPVTFTSLSDDTIGGDTNNDGQATLPDKGQWGHISFLNESLDSQNLIDHAIFRYGGYYRDHGCFYGGCGAEYHGPVWLFTASPTIRNNLVSNNDHGITAWNGSTPMLGCNNIHDNSAEGIYSNKPEIVVKAENQWWGSPTGPTHASNPGGAGQAVGDGVDFTPWSTSSCMAETVPTATPTNTPIVVPSPTNTPIPPPTATNTPLSPTATSTPVPPAGAPTISEIRPNQGRADVVNTINIYGAGFVQGATVRLDTAVLTATYIKATQFQAEIAAGLAPGLYDVTLTNPNGASVTLSDAYTVLGADNDDLTGYDYELWVDPAAPHANAEAKVGLVVHRQGGKQVVTNVVVHFYVGDPLAGGTLIGAGTVALLSPRSSANTTGVTWTPPAAGAYTIYAVIDPSNTIPEANEANNLIHHTVTVLAPAVDQLSPHVDSFAINSGALETAGRAVLLNTTASDPAPGTVASLFFIEYEYSQGANQWVPAQISPWLDYPTTRANYGWTLLPSIGMHYLQAWAMDRAGNISLLPYKAFITYNPPLHRVGQDQVQVYRYELQAGEQVLVRVQPNSGDPDLYVWAPDHATRPPWVSNLRTGVDDVSFVAPVAGVYQVEVYGFSAAEYQLVLDQRVAQAVAAQVHGGVDPNKSQFSQPRVPVANEPAQQYALPPSGQTVQAVYLPIVQR